MKFKNIAELLPFVRKPSGYLGGEINSVNPTRPHDVSFALCFPDAYEIGTAHFGLQILYHLLNRREGVMAERVFAPGLDLEKVLKASGLSLFSLETRRPLAAFDVLGFSLLYELNYTNLLTMLDLSRIPFYAEERDDSFPLVIAGGPCMFNPEPVADFFDAVVIGDGEKTVVEMADRLLAIKRQEGRGDKKEVLKQWASIPGVYLPGWYRAEYDGRGFQRLVPRPGAPEKISRAILPSLQREDFPDKPVLPFGKPVHDRLRLEVARGCSRGCRFCQAGMIYRPVRERSVEDVLTLTETALKNTGYEDLSLLSLSTGDYSGLNPLIEQLVCRYGGRNISVSVPSFRAGTLDSAAMELIKAIRKTGFTIAPEAGSQRLRDVINKNITEEDIARTVRDAFTLGWNLVKLYFMIGLPTETDQDVDEIVALVHRLARAGNVKGGRKKLNVSVATFIPKAHTPFQWESQKPLEEARERLAYLKKRLDGRQFGFKWQNPEVSFLEGVMSRGDRRLSKLIEAAYRKGCRFDGWSDCFDFSRWLAAAEEAAVDLDFFTRRPRTLEEPLPWDRIDSGLSREFLLSEREKAYLHETTPDCRQGKCSHCGVCDFSEIHPRFTRPDESGTSRAACFVDLPRQPPGQYKIEIVYSKTGPARFFGHLEFMNIFLRAINRANLPVVFTQGFHPMPKAAFPDPLPVGVESEQETMTLTISGAILPEAVTTALNRQLPEGIAVKETRIALDRGRRNKVVEQRSTYTIECRQKTFDAQAARQFQAAERFLHEKRNREGKIKTVDLKEVVTGLTVMDPFRLTMEIKEIPGKTVRPAEVTGALFGLSEETMMQARVVKRSSSS